MTLCRHFVTPTRISYALNLSFSVVFRPGRGNSIFSLIKCETKYSETISHVGWNKLERRKSKSFKTRYSVALRATVYSISFSPFWEKNPVENRFPDWFSRDLFLFERRFYSMKQKIGIQSSKSFIIKVCVNGNKVLLLLTFLIFWKLLQYKICIFKYKRNQNR